MEPSSARKCRRCRRRRPSPLAVAAITRYDVIYFAHFHSPYLHTPADARSKPQRAAAMCLTIYGDSIEIPLLLKGRSIKREKWMRIGERERERESWLNSELSQSVIRWADSSANHVTVCTMTPASSCVTTRLAYIYIIAYWTSYIDYIERDGERRRERKGERAQQASQTAECVNWSDESFFGTIYWTTATWCWVCRDVFRSV